MDNYRNKVKKRVVWLSIFIVFVVFIGIYDVFFLSQTEVVKTPGNMMQRFQIGLIIGLGGVAGFHRSRFARALKDEHELKLLCNRENDERMKVIRAKAGMPVLMICSVAILIAAITAGYFDITIFYTLLITSAAQLMLGLILKVYYMKTI
ncbi:MAG: hypothetical protein WBM02_12205 [bacterium]